MIFGIGIDIIEIERIRKSIQKFDKIFLNKIYTETELNYCLSKKNKYQHFAARFAAKEAIAKALATGWSKGFRWKDIEIFNESSGMPNVKLHGKLKSFLSAEKSLKITMSHSEHYVTCFAIIYSNNNSIEHWLKRELDIQSWNRREHYNLFKTYDNPFFNICANIEVTELLKYCKKKELSFFISSLYLSIKSANETEEFRYRIEDDKVYIYDIIHPFSTIFNNDNTFSFCEFKYSNDFYKFYDSAKTAIEKIKNNPQLLPKSERKDVIHFTTIPWISLTSMSHARKYNDGDSIPKIVFGKYFEDNAEIKMPFCIEVHHSLMDGYHVANYFNYLRSLIINCNSVLKLGA